jgi:glycosidase
MSERPRPPRTPRATSAASLLLACAGALATLPACSSSSSPPPAPLLHVASPDWRGQVIYFVMTDRFADGDQGNDDQHAGEFDPADKDKYSGGDLAGVTSHLDYIQGLGATAVWITPPVANMWWDPLAGSAGYHGYWARDPKKVDEHLGTLDTYKALSSALHHRGMYLVQDVVPNHMGNFFTYDPPSSYTAGNVLVGFKRNLGARPTAAPTLAPFDQVDATDPAQRAAAIYHWTPPIADYNDLTQQCTWQVSDLDDLDTANPVVRTALKDAYGYWIKEVGVDAFRVDTVKYVEHDFWADFFHGSGGILATAAGTGRSSFLAFGEVFDVSAPFDDAADRSVSSYLGTAAQPELPSVLQFPLYQELTKVFGSAAAPTSTLTWRVGRFLDRTLYPDPTLIPTFVDNHDVGRFLSAGSPAGLAQALAFIFTMPGIPVVYQGTEQGFTETRAAMFKGGYQSGGADHFDTGSAGYQRIKALARLRTTNPVFTTGETQVLFDNPGGAGAFVYQRTLPTDRVLVFLNTGEGSALVSDMATGLPAGTVLQSLYAEQATQVPLVGAGGKVMTVLPARSIQVVRATSQVVAPPPPAATIAVDTPIEGQVFTADTTITGTVSPPGTKVSMILDGQADVRYPVAPDPTTGAFSVVLPVSDFNLGTATHTLAFYSVPSNVATPIWTFTSDVAFVPVVTLFTDPSGDDAGPAGTYRYPTDSTFGHQQDLTGLKVEADATHLRLTVSIADWSTVWAPANGFDHVAFNLFFELPGVTGATVLPLLDASAPAGFTWRYDQKTYGWGNNLFTSTGATATAPGTPARSPALAVDPAGKAVIFTYNKRDFGLASWSGVRLYLTTWDIDGIQNLYRPVDDLGGQWTYQSGQAGGAPYPKIMDSLGPVAIP